MLSAIVLPIINRLLVDQPALQRQLQVHAGKVVLIIAGSVSLAVRVTESGQFSKAGLEDAPAVSIELPASALGRLLDGPAAMSSQAKIGGDAGLAEVLSRLASELRPDIGALLSPVLGDVLANRVENGLQAFSNAIKRGFEGASSNLNEYFRDEARMVLGARESRQHGDELAALRDRLARLEKRVALL